MTNTQKRIVSAFTIIAGVIGIFLIGPEAVLAFVAFVGLLAIDELLVNFLKRSRASVSYLFSQVLFVGSFAWLNFLQDSPEPFRWVAVAACLVNIVLLIFLFTNAGFSKKLRRTLEKYPPTSAVLLGLPFLSFSSLFQNEKWIIFCWSFLFVTYFVDTGAWFFGKRYGKNKLWPAVSPGKTVEGTVGGVMSSVILSTLYWSFLIGPIQWSVLLFLIGLSLASQTGDLVQSKFKRIYGLKDSSTLIPGHGGVYDRVDSLIFVAPFYAFMLEFVI